VTKNENEAGKNKKRESGKGNGEASREEKKNT
jgi:hypothetical protein